MKKIEDINELKKQSLKMRIAMIDMLSRSASGHGGGAMGLADIFTVLYFNYLNHNPKDPNDSDRDFVLLSNGHTCPIWYTVLAYSGYFHIDELNNLRKLGSFLQGHPKNTEIPGVFNSSGPLGHGTSQALGLAYGLKLDDKKNRVYCIMSDGEQQEGQTYETMLIANKFKLNNLTFILDKNNIQIDGFIDDIMPLPDLEKLYTLYGFNVLSIDGNSVEEIIDAFNNTSIL